MAPEDTPQVGDGATEKASQQWHEWALGEHHLGHDLRLWHGLGTIVRASSEGGESKWTTSVMSTAIRSVRCAANPSGPANPSSGRPTPCSTSGVRTRRTQRAVGPVWEFPYPDPLRGFPF